MSTSKTRINKYLSEIGFCSRRKADTLIEEGRILVNGKPPEMGVKVSSEDLIQVDGKIIDTAKEKPVYLLFNKPVGIVCTTDTKREKDNIIDYINYPTRIFPVGRLDKASEGLIILTNDGDIVNKILRGHNQHEKEYHVWVNKPIDDSFIKKMSSGVPILGTVTRKCKVEQLGEKKFKIILTQGLNRQIRRMSEYFNYNVTRLMRVRIMNLQLDLPVGNYREITAQEFKELNTLLHNSSKVAPETQSDTSTPPTQETTSKKRRKRKRL